MSLVDGFAILMFVILIYLLSKIIIDKNAQAISMTKILGYTNWEISRLYILSTSIVVVLFLLISLPIESIIMTGLFRAIMITSITGWIPLYMDPVIYVKNVKKLIAMDGDKVYGTFWSMNDDYSIEPHIRIAAGDYKDLCNKWGKDSALTAILLKLLLE